MTRRFVVNGCPPVVTARMLASSAEANTSTPAPSRICSRKADVAAKLSTMSVPGFSASNADSISEKAMVSDEAAETTTRSSAELDPHAASSSTIAATRLTPNLPLRSARF